jgi:hypothetical protein
MNAQMAENLSPLASGRLELQLQLTGTTRTSSALGDLAESAYQGLRGAELHRRSLAATTTSLPPCRTLPQIASPSPRGDGMN